MTTTTASHYVSPAFYSQYNLILLGGSALFSLASASPLPLLCGVAGEVSWLLLGPRLSRFRRFVDDRASALLRQRYDAEVNVGLASLTPEHAARVASLGQEISQILQQAKSLVLSPSERDHVLELEALRPAFVRLCQLRQRVHTRAEELRSAPPELEVAALSQQYAAEKDLALRFTLHQAIKQAHKRVELQARSVEVERQVELKLALVEQSLSQLRAQAQLGVSGAQLAHDAQAVLTQLVLLPALEVELDG